MQHYSRSCREGIEVRSHTPKNNVHAGGTVFHYDQGGR